MRRGANAAALPPRAANGTFVRGASLYGFSFPVPGRPDRGPGTTPALHGLFRAGATVGVSQINALATNVPRGSR